MTKGQFVQALRASAFPVRPRLVLLVTAALAMALPVQVAHASGGTTTGADLQMSGSASTGNPKPGQAFTLTYQVKNAGPQTATGSAFIDPLNDGITISSAAVNGNSGACGLVPDPSGVSSLQCNLGDMASSSQLNIVEDAVAPIFTGTYIPNAYVTSAVADPNLSNNSPNITVKVTTSGGNPPPVLVDGPCATMTVQNPPTIRIGTNGSTSGVITLKANITSCSSLTQSPLVLNFNQTGGGQLFSGIFSCVYPPSPDGSATSFSLAPGATVGASCNGQPYLVGGDQASSTGTGTATLYSGCNSWGVNPIFVGATVPCTNVLATGTYTWVIDTTIIINSPPPVQNCPRQGCVL